MTVAFEKTDAAQVDVHIAAPLKEAGEAALLNAGLIGEAPFIAERVFGKLGASVSRSEDSLSYGDLKEAAYAERFGAGMGWS